MKIHSNWPHWHDSTSHHRYGGKHRPVEEWPWWKLFELWPVRCGVSPGTRVMSWNIWLYFRMPDNPAWCWSVWIRL